MKKIDQIKNKFYYDEEGNIELCYYGQYKNGLTKEEIKDYLRARSGKYRIETVWKDFCEVAGVNTVGVYMCPCCDYTTSLMYRHDVERFANVLFNNTETYWD